MKYKDLDIDHKRHFMIQAAALYYILEDLAKFSKTSPECLAEYFQKKANDQVNRLTDRQVEQFLVEADKSIESDLFRVVYTSTNEPKKRPFR